MADETEHPSFPEPVDAAGVYRIKGSTLNAILAEIRKNKVRVEEGSGLIIKEIGPNGTLLGLDTVICPTS